MNMKKKLHIFILLLVLAMILSACDLSGIGAKLDALRGITHYEDMVYTRPDMATLQQSLQDGCEMARGSDLDAIVEGILAFYDAYDSFYTNLSLAYIRYSGDMTDLYWSEEYTYCADRAAEADAALEELFVALAASPCREELESEEYYGPDFFDQYESGGVYDETLMDYLEQESELVNRYYDLSTQALEQDTTSEAFFDSCGAQMQDLFVALIRVRQEMARYLGYADYPQFAYDFYYYRDYTPTQAADYLDAIQQELVPLYRQAVNLDHLWTAGQESCSESQTFAYTRSAAQAMGGAAAEAFDLLEQAGLYDIRYGENKYNASFEVYLDSYYEPFIFMNPTGTGYDKLTFSHEFGHFIHDYVGTGAYSVDVSEVMSQGMEYLSLCYGDGGEALTVSKLADCLCVYVEQAAYASFEQQVYGLTGSELTAERVLELFGQVTADFGFDEWQEDSRNYVFVTHFFTNPMYIMSYVVSNDGAFQLYQQEQTREGAGRELYEKLLTSQQTCFLALMEEVGLEDPFTSDRIPAVRQTLETGLLENG